MTDKPTELPEPNLSYAKERISLIRQNICDGNLKATGDFIFPNDLTRTKFIRFGRPKKPIAYLQEREKLLFQNVLMN
jgi:hypothetical protein